MPRAAIVDYGMGNLFSVARACEQVGMQPCVTESAPDIERADVLILPGVGAFGDAMHAIRSRDLEAPIRDAISRGTPLFGICLGMQVLFSESEEFGRHAGLGIIDGTVRRLAPQGRKVPHIAWAPVVPVRETGWDGTPLEAVEHGACLYFVHSYVVAPREATTVLAVSSYGGMTFPAAVAAGDVFACQFHPERSGPQGLEIYRAIARRASRAAAGSI